MLTELVFDEFVDYSVQWGAYNIPHAEYCTYPPATNHTMSCGLASLYELATAQSRDERVEALQGGKVSEPSRLASYDLVFREIWPHPQNTLSVRKHAFYNDPDPSPLKA